jgi:hypothetical protein
VRHNQLSGAQAQPNNTNNTNNANSVREQDLYRRNFCRGKLCATPLSACATIPFVGAVLGAELNRIECSECAQLEMPNDISNGQIVQTVQLVWMATLGLRGRCGHGDTCQVASKRALRHGGTTAAQAQRVGASGSVRMMELAAAAVAREHKSARKRQQRGGKARHQRKHHQRKWHHRREWR